ncbi:MAG TPA: DUF1127 domain-containing protein [Xanthobacteraceae bacterium]|nr:DUF1127 domain-containing protein [Xanthobacteraceae bacterium]
MSTTFAHHGTGRSYWNQVKHQFTEWRRRSQSRSELQFLSDQSLRDIGLSRCEVHRETGKPFWAA